jgi:replication-associated recombination protein RarA
VTLRVAPNLNLPETAHTQTLVVYGGKGMGKTNFGSVLVEELAKRDLRFSVIDALDVWWGLQHGATKQSRGLDQIGRASCRERV